jgi:hypothetical protein
LNLIRQMNSAQDRLKTDLTAAAVGKEDLAEQSRDLAQKLEAAQLGIPVKVNIDSGGKPNGIPEGR